MSVCVCVGSLRRWPRGRCRDQGFSPPFELYHFTEQISFPVTPLAASGPKPPPPPYLRALLNYLQFHGCLRYVLA